MPGWMSMEGNLLVPVDYERPVIALDDSDNLIFNFDFSAQPLSDGTNSAAIKSAISGAGFAFTRASTATCQTSANTVVTSGIAVDDPRIGNRGQGQGLISEDQRTNVCQRARNVGGTGWGAGSTVTSGQTGPDGGASAARIQTASGAAGTTATTGATITNRRCTTSAWVKDAGSGGSEQMSTANASANALATTPSSSWTRIEYVHADTGTSLTVAAADGTDQSANGGTTAGARDTLIDLVQHEDSGSTSGGEARATSAIVTTGANATRSADRLKLPWTKFSTGGRARLRIVFIPFFLLSEASGNRYLVSDGTDYFRLSSGQPVAHISTDSSANVGFTQPAWAIGDLVDIYFEFGNGYPYYASRINNGQPYVVPASSVGWTASQSSLNLTADPHVHSWTDGTLKFQGIIKQISGFAVNSRPGWVP